MTFLCLDTGGDYGVLALADDASGTVTAARIFLGRRTLSRRLMGELDTLLHAENITLAELTGIAVGTGPGSFTGVRVGVTTAKTLAQVTDTPLVGIGTLDAYAACLPVGTNVPVLHSRRSEVYAAVYQNGQQTEAPFAASPEHVMERLRAFGDVLVCGQPHLLDWPGRALSQPWTPPDGLARLAAARLQSGSTDNWLSLVPLYVVPPSISTPRNQAILPPLETETP